MIYGRAKPLSASMLEALQNLSDGEQRHGAHVLPGRNGHQRITPLRALKDRGLIVQIRQPYSWSSAKDVEWCITDAGRAALKADRDDVATWKKGDIEIIRRGSGGPLISQEELDRIIAENRKEP